VTLAGDVICLALPGGGGFGDPRARDPQRVLHDVLDGLISVDAARQDYGVAIDADLQLNLAETQRLRAEA
jgi:N-methylhydantoinase B